MKELIKEKQATQYDLLEIEAQLQLDRYYQTKAKNDLNYSKLLLQHLLNIETHDSFDVVNSLADSISIRSHNDTSISTFPELLKIELNTERQIYLLKLATGRYYPALDLNGSVGSGYSQNNKMLNSNGEYVPRPFGQQINNNLYQSVMITLSIPIFNKNVNKTRVKIRELELKSLAVDKQSEYNQLKQKLEQLSLDISNLSDQLKVLEKAYQSALLNYNNFQIRYENGDISFAQLIENRNKLMSTESELLQANYQLLFKQTVLGFYYF